MSGLIIVNKIYKNTWTLAFATMGLLACSFLQLLLGLVVQLVGGVSFDSGTRAAGGTEDSGMVCEQGRLLTVIYQK